MEQSTRAVSRDKAGLFLAFFLAPLAPGAVLAMIIAFAGVTVGGWGVSDVFGSTLVVFVLCLVTSSLLSYPVAFVLGVPAYLLLHTFGYRSCLAYATVCTVLGFVAWPCLWLVGWGLSHEPPKPASVLSGLVLGAAFGAIAGVTFWLIARPNQTHTTAGGLSGNTRAHIE